MVIESILGGIVVSEALPEELIATELFEAGSPWLELHDVEATQDTISGAFIIHALNGNFEYRLTRWVTYLPHVAAATRVSVPDGFTNPTPAATCSR